MRTANHHAATQPARTKRTSASCVGDIASPEDCAKPSWGNQLPRNAAGQKALGSFGLCLGYAVQNLDLAGAEKFDAEELAAGVVIGKGVAVLDLPGFRNLSLANAQIGGGDTARRLVNGYFQ